MPEQRPEFSDLVPFRSFNSLAEAEVLEVVLKNAGIFAIVPADDAFDGLEPFERDGVPVLIRRDDVARAEAAIRAARDAGEELAEGRVPPQAKGD